MAQAMAHPKFYIFTRKKKKKSKEKKKRSTYAHG